MNILSQSFYDRKTLQVAQDLLGCFLIRKIDDKIIKTKIVEVEAYNGPYDLASHASHGLTDRNKIMFGEPGIIYVYFTYGMHYMLNIVTESKNYPAAILIRAVEPISAKNFQFSIFNFQTAGPAKLTKVLQVDKFFNGLPIYIKKHGLWIEDRAREDKFKIVKVKRVGVDYAGSYKDKLWRFYIRSNKYISKT
jgi:DNA-3-methyladenine glycosylase